MTKGEVVGTAVGVGFCAVWIAAVFVCPWLGILFEKAARKMNEKMEADRVEELELRHWRRLNRGVYR